MVELGTLVNLVFLVTLLVPMSLVVLWNLVPFPWILAHLMIQQDHALPVDPAGQAHLVVPVALVVQAILLARVAQDLLLVQELLAVQLVLKSRAIPVDQADRVVRVVQVDQELLDVPLVLKSRAIPVVQAVQADQAVRAVLAVQVVPAFQVALVVLFAPVDQVVRFVNKHLDDRRKFNVLCT